MIVKNVELETVCGITSKLPENNMPEIAFAGKSNVGKSPYERFKIGQKIKIMIKSIDRRTNRVILTYKELLRNMARKYKRL